MKCINLIDAFDTETEVLEIDDTSMVYAIDCKNEVMDMCRIERCHFESGEKETLAVLDYTRLYESFQTYGQSKDYFYAVNVLQDYRLRLRRINKKTWAPEGELVIEALGEILNLYLIDEQYLLVIDEVEKTDELMHLYSMNDDGGNYLNLCYLYDIYTKKRYPVTDKRLHGLLETVKVCGNDENCIVFAVSRGIDMDDELRAAKCVNGQDGPSSAVYKADKKAFIRAVTQRTPLFLEEICISDRFSAVRFYENDNDEIVYRLRNCESRTEQIVLHDINTGKNRIIRQYPYEEGGLYFYDSWNYHVYYEPDYDIEDMTESEITYDKQVICVTDSGRSFCYNSRFGEFSGIYRDQTLITTFYKEVMVKEYEYHEYVAVHDMSDDAVPVVCEGRFAAYRDTIVLLKTFLAL